MNKKIFAIGIITLILDQVTKLLIDTFLEMEEIITIFNRFFYLTRVTNTGAAFSILEGRTMFLSIISVAAIVMMIILSKDFVKNRRTNMAFGLLLGGILGNFSDRLFLGYVRDFLKFDIFGYNYPVFNIADSAIVVGVTLLVISMFRGDDKNGSSSKRVRNSD